MQLLDRVLVKLGHGLGLPSRYKPLKKIGAVRPRDWKLDRPIRIAWCSAILRTTCITDCQSGGSQPAVTLVVQAGCTILCCSCSSTP
jgi:hypothetical protein